MRTAEAASPLRRSEADVASKSLLTFSQNRDYAYRIPTDLSFEKASKQKKIPDKMKSKLDGRR